MFRFESHQYFYFIFLAILFWIAAAIFNKRSQKKLAHVFGSRLTVFLTSSLSIKKRRIKWALQFITLILLLIAWARPQMGQTRQEVKSEGFELMLMVDVSESMLTEDVKPSRLEQAKKELQRLVDLMPGNKTGVIAFAGNAALISPLTNDPSAVKMYLDSLTPDSVSEQGTCFECALKIAKEGFERGGASADESSAKVTRVILIASDGEDHEPGALDLAEKLKKEHMRLFTVAYGTEKGGAIPVRDPTGYLRGYKKDRSGQTILSTVNGEELRKLAAAGEGSFYFASFGGDHIKNLVEDFDKLEKTMFESSMATQYEEKFQIFIILALVFALIEIFMGEKNKSFRFWKGRYEVPQ